MKWPFSLSWGNWPTCTRNTVKILNKDFIKAVRGGHRFMKLFHKIPLFLGKASLTVIKRIEYIYFQWYSKWFVPNSPWWITLSCGVPESGGRQSIWLRGVDVMGVPNAAMDFLFCWSEKYLDPMKFFDWRTGYKYTHFPMQYGCIIW